MKHAAEKKQNKAAAAFAANQVTVDAAKLALGLKTTFVGLSMVFDSLCGAADATEHPANAVEHGTQTAERSDRTQMEEANETADKTTGAGDGPAPDGCGNDSADQPDKEREEEPDAAAGESIQHDAAAQQIPVSHVTQDDITKIIVQKIKQNRSNNEKIGKLLKTYGVAKVSEIPAAQYEAFLTDLAAI